MLTKTAAPKPRPSAKTSTKKTPAKKNPATAKKSAGPTKSAKPAALGALPEWDLSALYAGIDAPEIKRDLARADADCNAFEERYKGKLAALAGGPDGGRALAAAVKELEAIDDLMGRLASFAQLVYTGNTADPARAKFFGDVQEQITTSSSHLLFFSLELNKIDDDVLERTMADPALGHYRPWIEDVRKEKPYQLEDRIEQLFHEKSVTGQGAWNRLFDDTIASLRFKVGAKTLAIEPTLNLLQDRSEKTRRTAAEALAKTFGENLRTFTLITNTLAKDKEISDRWRGFADIADARHLANRVEPEVVEALVAAVRGAYPRLSHRYYALKARWFGTQAARPLGSQRAVARCAHADHPVAGGEGHGAVGLWRVLAADGGYRRAVLHRALDRCAWCGPASRRAPSRTRPCLRRIPISC